MEKHRIKGPYEFFLKRLLDILVSLIVLIIFSPIFLLLIIIGFTAMKGNPFFTQDRPGKNEKVFKLIKFRTMSNAKDAEGNLLPDDKRINSYGKFLRASSLDELPELINILIGNMSIIGPRPLLVRYLPYYTETEKHRHDVRPGLTGLAQVNGRNFLDWEKRFALDVEYVNNITFLNDAKIIFKTVGKVFKKSDVMDLSQEQTIENFDDYRIRQRRESEQ